MTTREARGLIGGSTPPPGTIDRILHQAIDMHCHGGPDPRIERRMDAVQLALYAQELGQRGFVFKSHDYPTTPVAHLLAKVAPRVSVFGSVTLDEEVGGINPQAVEASAKMGAKVVWMPTLTSLNDRRKHGTGDTGVTILDSTGRVTPQLRQVVKLARDYDMVVATGHISTQEVFALMEEAKQQGVTRVVVSHVLLPIVGPDLTMEQIVQLADMGATIEFCYITCMPPGNHLTPQKMAEAAKTIGVGRCILSTDFGQYMNPPPPEGMRMMIANMLRAGLTAQEVETMVAANPAALLGV